MRVDYRPRRLRWICYGLAALVIVVFGALALALPGANNDDAHYAIGDQIGFFGIGVLLAVGALVFTRFRVRADETGVGVRNALGERWFPWDAVVAVDLPDGGTWAQLELQRDETVAILAIQISDGDVAIDALIDLRRLLREHRA